MVLLYFFAFAFGSISVRTHCYDVVVAIMVCCSVGLVERADASIAHAFLACGGFLAVRKKSAKAAVLCLT
jgi:hypothetical protein